MRIMDVYWDAVFYFGGGVLLLATVLWLSATVYLYLVHRRYDHIPRPPMPRYVFNIISSSIVDSKGGRGHVHVLKRGPVYLAEISGLYYVAAAIWPWTALCIFAIGIFSHVLRPLGPFSRVGRGPRTRLSLDMNSDAMPVHV